MQKPFVLAQPVACLPGYPVAATVPDHRTWTGTRAAAALLFQRMVQQQRIRCGARAELHQSDPTGSTTPGLRTVHQDLAQQPAREGVVGLVYRGAAVDHRCHTDAGWQVAEGIEGGNMASVDRERGPKPRTSQRTYLRSCGVTSVVARYPATVGHLRRKLLFEILGWRRQARGLL